MTLLMTLYCYQAIRGKQDEGYVLYTQNIRWVKPNKPSIVRNSGKILSRMPRDLGTLDPGEAFLFQIRPVARALIPYFIITVILAGTIIFLPLALLMGIALVLLYLVSFRTVRYIITTDRINAAETYLRRSSRHLFLHDPRF